MAEVAPVLVGARDRIVAKAKELAIKYKDSAYYSPQNKSEAARRLGISRPRLMRLLDGGDEETGDAGTDGAR